MAEISSDEDLMRELRYCSYGPGMRHKAGRIGRAQDRLLREGLLAEHPDHPGYLIVTAAGAIALDEAAAC